MAITFPSSPSPGDIFTSNGKSWQYVNGKWESYGETVAPDVFAVDAANDVVYVYGSLSAGASASVDTDLVVGGDFTIDTDTLYVDSVNDRVGIGTTSPASLLEVSSATGTTPTSPSEVRISTSTSGSNWSETAPWGQLSFYTADTSYGGAGVRAAVAAMADHPLGGLSRLGFFLSPAGGSLTEYMSVTHYGSVGIGTTSPARSPLHIHKSDTDATEIHLTNAESGLTSSDGLTIFYDDTTNGAGIWMREAGPLRFATSGSERVRIDSSGNVGIGTTSPSKPLTVSGDIQINDGTPAIFLTDTDTGADSRLSASSAQGSVFLEADINDEVANTNIVFKSDGATRMTINSSGNVGIGTTNPGALLHVSSGTSGDAEIRIQADSDNNDENDNPILTFMQDGSAFAGIIGMTNNQLNIVNASNASQGIKMGVVAANTTSGQDAIASMTTPALEVTPGNNVKVNGDLTVFGSIYHDVSGATSSDPVIWVDGENIDVPLIRVGTDQWSTSSDHGFTIQYNGSGSANLNSLQILADGETAANQINALTVVQNGRIGLGAANPQAALHISNNTTPLVYVRNSTNGAGARIQFTDQNTEAQKGYMTYYHADGSSYGRGNAFVFDSTESSLAVVSTDDFVSVGTLQESYSDERLKTMNGTIPNALEKLSGIRGYLYTQNEIADSLGFKEVGVQQVGVSAQEVMAVLPEVVTTAPISYTDRTEEEYYTVRYQRMIPLLIESIHELTARIEALESAP